MFFRDGAGVQVEWQNVLEIFCEKYGRSYYLKAGSSAECSDWVTAVLAAKQAAIERWCSLGRASLPVPLPLRLFPFLSLSPFLSAGAHPLLLLSVSVSVWSWSLARDAQVYCKP